MLVLIVSSVTAAMVIIPFASETLQFINENGIVNLYMIMLSYLLAPNTDEDQVITVVDHNGVTSADHNGVMTHHDGQFESFETEIGCEVSHDSPGQEGVVDVEGG